jgi:hypothetical protein
MHIREALMDRSHAPRGTEPRTARWLICMAVLAVIFLLAMSGLAFADTWTDISDSTRQTQQSTTGPNPPASVEPARGGLPAAGGAGETVIVDVPAYAWRHGCGPTAVGMIVGYYDGHGFDALIPGSAATQTEAVDQAIASQGSSGAPRHYEDYALPMDASGTNPSPLPDKSEAPAGDEHASDSVADFMHTSWSSDGNYYGWSWSDKISPSFVGFATLKSRTYVATSTTYLMASTLSWTLVKAEIDSSRPMVFLVDSSGDGSTDHFVTIIGYRETSGYPEYACWDTWSTTSVRWARFRAMSGSYSWGVWGGFTFGLTSTTAPASITVTAPNGGETWPLGSTQTITWTSTGLTGNVKIQLSRDGGVTWPTTIAASTPNDGTHPWMVSGAASTRARVRITSTATGRTRVTGASNANFTLGAAIPGAYAVGDTGPAGGIIFYDKGATDAGWRYLEAAPASTERHASWGVVGTAIPEADGTAIGTGRQNTADIVAIQGPGTTYAAQLCDGLTYGGYSDWFLPSRDELNLMYTNLYRRGFGGFRPNQYWSSSERGTYYAWHQNFRGGYYFYYKKDLTDLVRAVRAF